MATKQKYSVKKYDGDDSYSYAVFKSEDVRGMSNPIFYGDAKPIYCGLDRHQASYYKKQLEDKS